MPRAIARGSSSHRRSRPMLADARPRPSGVGGVRARVERPDEDPTTRCTLRRNVEGTTRVQRSPGQARGEHVLGGDAAKARELEVRVANQAGHRAPSPLGDRDVRAARRLADEKPAVRGAFTSARRRLHTHLVGAPLAAPADHRRVAQTRRVGFTARAAATCRNGHPRDDAAQRSISSVHAARREQVIRHVVTVRTSRKLTSRCGSDAHASYSRVGSSNLRCRREPISARDRSSRRR